MIRTQKVIEVCSLFVCSLVITFLVFYLNGHSIGIDDADIFFVYAKNLADGKGLLFSQGIPHVEGYTSTLWMLLCAGIFLMGLNEQGVLYASILIFVGTHLIVFRVIEKHLPSAKSYPSKVLYLGILAGSAGYCSWTTISLMDMGLWSFLVIGMTYVALYGLGDSKISIGAASLLFLLAPLARPEAFVFCPVILLIMILKNGTRHTYRAGGFSLFASFLVSTVGLTCFRLTYFGYGLPNTYYAKVSGSLFYNLKNGARYLLDYLSYNTLASIAFFVSIFWTGTMIYQAVLVKTERNRKFHAPLESDLTLISFVVMMGFGIPVISGGDHFNLFRFYQPIYPLIALQTVLSGIKLKSKWNEANRLIGVLLLIWIVLFAAKDNFLHISRRGSPLAFEFSLSKNGRALGVKLNSLFSKFGSGLPSIGVVAAGGIALSYKGTVFDLMGLNNSFMAHFPGDRTGPKNHAAFQKEAFYLLPIDVLILPTSPEDDFLQAALKGLFDDPGFIEGWTYASVSSKRNGDISFTGFFRKQFLNEEMDNPHYLFREIGKRGR